VARQNELRVYDLPPGEAHTYIQNFFENAYNMEFDPFGERVLIRFVENGKGFARVWPVAKPGDEIKIKLPITAALWRRDDWDLKGFPLMHFCWLIVFTENGQGLVLDPITLVTAHTFDPTGHQVTQIESSPNQDAFLVSGPRGLWWVVDRKKEKSLSAPFREDDVGSMLFLAPDGKALATGVGPAGFAAWDMRAPYPTVQQETALTKIGSRAQSPDGR
jgi:hypothetical protein